MKRFVLSVATATVFFLGLGALVEQTGASLKSDERALGLVRKARVAIGGDAAIASVESMVIKGRTTKTFSINGTSRTETGETEIAMQMPDQLMKMMSLGDTAGTGHKVVDHNVIVVGGDGAKMKVRVEGDGKKAATASATSGGNVTTSKKIIIKNADGTTRELTGAEADAWIAAHPDEGEIRKEVVVRSVDRTSIKGGDGERVFIGKPKDGHSTFTSKDGKTFNVDGHDIVMKHGDGARNNELLRLTVGLLLTSPRGMDVSYIFGGESNIDGTACNIVVASFGGQSFKLFLDRTSNLPVAMNFTAPKMPPIVHFDRKVDGPADGAKDVKVFARPATGPSEMADYQVRFADYRSVGGVQLPHRWTQTVGGNVDETYDVTGYEINPANIGEKFQNQKVFVRTATPESK